jgi:hypothetical protein
LLRGEERRMKQSKITVTLRLPVYSQWIRLGVKPFECSSWTLAVYHNILSDDRMGLSFTIVAGPRLCSHSRVRFPRDLWPYCLSQIRDSRNLEGQVPVFTSPRNMVAQLCPQALGSLFVASYDSQGCGGGVRTRLHTASPNEAWTSCKIKKMDFVSHRERTVSPFS